MVFDAPTFLLLLLALLGRRRRPTVVRATLRRWKRSALGLFVAGALVGTLGPFEWTVMVALALIELSVMVLFVGAHAGLRRPWSRGAARLAVALFFHVVFVLLAPNIRFEAAEGTTPLWFVDLVARGWTALIEPALRAVGAGAAAPQILEVLTPGLAFLGATLVPLQFVWSYVAIGWVLRLVTPDALGADAPDPEPLSRGSVGLFAVVFLLAQGPEAAFGPRLLAQGLSALFALHGAWWLLVRGVGRGAPRWRAPLVAAVTVVLFAHPVLWRLLGALGVVEVATRPWRAPDEATRRATEAGAAWLRRSLGPTVLVGFAIPALVAGGAITELITGASALRSVAPPAHEVDDPDGGPLRLPGADGEVIHVDRYELPNQRGVEPRVGLTPQAAADACRARGARLCTVDELGLVCGSGRGERFLGGGEQGFFSGETVWRLQSDCNFGRVTDDGVRALQPTGDSPACRGDWAVYDLVGNASEWAVLPERPGFFGLVGSDYRYDDLRLLTCGTYILVPESFIDDVDLRAAGARCCR